MIVAEEIEQCVKRDGTVLRGATGRDFMPFPGSLSQGMTCKCKRRDVLRCKYMKSLTFPRHVQAPLHLVYCGSWCVTQVYTAYLTSAVIFKRERERERKRQRGRKECRFSYFRIFSFLCYHLDGKTDLLR